MSAVRDEDSAFPVDSVVLEHLKFVEKSLRIDDHACAKKNRLVRIQDSARNLMKLVLFSIHNDCVSGIRTACVANDIFGIFCQIVNDFTFSLIAPLSADYNNLHKKAPKFSLIELKR